MGRRSTDRGLPPLMPLLVILGMTLYAGYHLRTVLAPFLLSFALAYLLNPIINWMESRAFRREAAVCLFYILVAAGLSVAAQRLAPEVKREAALLKQNLPSYLEKGQTSLLSAQKRVLAFMPLDPKVARQITEDYSGKLHVPVFKQIENIPAYVIGIFPFLSLFFLIPFITFFLLLNWHDMFRGLIQLCPGRYVEQTLYITSEIESSLGNYLRGIIIVILAIGSASYVGLRVMDMNYSLAIATLSGVSSFIPYLGAVMGAVVGGIAAWVQFGTIVAGLKVVLLFSCIRLADEAFVQPVVSKHAVKLHPLVYILSLMIGGELFGFVGLIFAVPTACIIKALLKVGWEWYTSEGYLRTHAPIDSAGAPYT